MPDPLADLKSQIRRDAVARRDALPAAERAAAAEAIAARPFPLAIAPGTIVSGFMPLKSEINPLPLMRRLADAGARLALPVVDGRGKPLIMRAFAFGDTLEFRPMGHPRAETRGGRGRARYPARAAARLRSQGKSHRLWRRAITT